MEVLRESFDLYIFAMKKKFEGETIVAIFINFIPTFRYCSSDNSGDFESEASSEQRLQSFPKHSIHF